MSKQQTTIKSFLENGDIAGLIEYRRSMHGDLRMEATDGAGEGDNGGTATGAAFEGPKTQEDLDALINQATAKVHKKYTGFDALKAKAAQFDALQSGQHSDLAKVTEERDGATKRLSQFEGRLIATAADAAAAKHKSILRGADLLTLTGKDGVTVGDDGQVTGIEDLFQKYLETNPQYVGSDTNGTPAPGRPVGGFDGGAAGTVKTDLDSQIAAAEAAGDRPLARKLKAQKLAAQ